MPHPTARPSVHRFSRHGSAQQGSNGASPYNPPLKSVRDASVHTNSSRKRPRSTGYDYFTKPEDSSVGNERSSPDHMSYLKTTESILLPSPPPLVNTNYRCAGGLDTPSAEATARYEAEEDFSDCDIRRRWTSSNNTAHGDERQVFTVGALSRERNGGKKRSRASLQERAQGAESWSNYVLRIAGAVWNFCSENAFTGFKAGGGASYDWQSMHTPGRQRQSTVARESTPVPGQFPDDYETIDPDSPSAEMEGRPSKRRQTGSNAGEDWVMVDGTSGSPYQDTRRTSSAANSPSIMHTYKSRLPRYSHASRPSMDRQLEHRASTARLFSSATIHNSDRPSMPTRAASYASPRASLNPRPRSSMSTKGPSPTNKSSPIAPEIQQYTEKRQREERQADVKLRQMNNQLKAMIAEGQQALATKIEVDDRSVRRHRRVASDLEDEGYGEGYGSDETVTRKRHR